MSNSSSTSIEVPSSKPTQSHDVDAILDNTNATNTHTEMATTITAAAEAATVTATAVPAPVTALPAPTATNTQIRQTTCDTNDSSAADSCDDDLYYETQPRSLAALAERDRRREQLYLQKLAKKQQQEQSVNNNTSIDRNVLVDRRRDVALIQANAIDSSSVMIVNESRVSCENNVTKNQRATIATPSSGNEFKLSGTQTIKTATINNKNKNLNNSTNNQLNNTRNFGALPNLVGGGDTNINQSDKIYNMDNKSYNSAINVPVSTAAATGKSASLPPKMNYDKKTKPGFLSRFTNFRFSLRGSKKKLKSFDNTMSPSSNGANNIVLVSKRSTSNSFDTAINNDQVAMRNKTNNNNNGGTRAGCYQRNSMRSNEFEYIPLKDPIAVVFDTPSNQTSDKRAGNLMYATNTNSPIASMTATTTKNVARNVRNDNNGANATAAFVAAERQKNVLTSKPPLPRQPPRVVGVCAKQPSTLNSTPLSSSYQIGHKAATLAQSNPQREGVKQRHAQQHQQRATSAPREINFNHRTDNGNKYQEQHHHQNFHYLANDDDYQLLSSRQTNESEYSRASGGGFLKGAVSSDGLLMDVTENSYCTGDEDEDDGKIGLIETNLDTDETIISGKTRSLMELGPQMAVRSSATAVNHRLGKHGAKGTDPTTIEPRRPHKSMEFLLDKENQRFVLVSKSLLTFNKTTEKIDNKITTKCYVLIKNIKIHTKLTLMYT